MKLMKRSGIYQCSKYNCTFNPKTVEAWSYRWWRFVAKVDGVVVFNSYRYGNTTSKHQSKVRSLMSQLGIKIDIFLELPRGIKHGMSLAELIQEGEETLCDQYLRAELKRDERNARARQRRLEKKLENHLENVVHFRDYKIKSRDLFGSINEVAVHQCVDSESFESDVENALHSFHRDGFGSVVFYVGGSK